MARILMVVRPSEGGAFEHVSSLARQLVARGHDVAVCGPHGHVEGLGVEIVELDIVRPLAPAADARAAAGLARIVRRFRPDLVHAHGSKGGVMARATRAAARAPRSCSHRTDSPSPATSSRVVPSASTGRSSERSHRSPHA